MTVDTATLTRLLRAYDGDEVALAVAAVRELQRREQEGETDAIAELARLREILSAIGASERSDN